MSIEDADEANFLRKITDKTIALGITYTKRGHGYVNADGSYVRTAIGGWRFNAFSVKSDGESLIYQARNRIDVMIGCERNAGERRSFYAKVIPNYTAGLNLVMKTICFCVHYHCKGSCRWVKT